MVVPLISILLSCFSFTYMRNAHACMHARTHTKIEKVALKSVNTMNIILMIHSNVFCDPFFVWKELPLGILAENQFLLSNSIIETTHFWHYELVTEHLIYVQTCVKHIQISIFFVLCSDTVGIVNRYSVKITSKIKIILLLI